MKRKVEAVLQKIIGDLKRFGWVIIGLVFYWIISRMIFGEFCPMKILTGLPCPGCGMTRAVFLMLIGHFAESFAMHPLALAWILLAAYFCICRYFLNRKPKGAAVAAIILCVVMVPVYLYRMAVMFPHQPPMVYTPTPIGELILLLLQRVREGY